MSIDAMKQVLEALETLARYENPETKIQNRKKDGGSIVTIYPHKIATDAANLLREALARQEQEPVGQLQEDAFGRGQVMWFDKPADQTMLYTAPQPAVQVTGAMKVVLAAMQSDPDYAWSWHCNVAMSFVDAGGDHYIANQGAARFMKLLANVEPAHELPTKQPAIVTRAEESFAAAKERGWQGLTEEEIEVIEAKKAPPVHPDFIDCDDWMDFARAIEAKLKEKNA